MYKLAKTFLQFFVVFLALLAAGAALAWTGPLSSPPTCISGNPGCDAPINVSATSQTKAGPFMVSVSPGATWAVEGKGDQYGVYGIGSSYGVYGQSSGGWAVEGNGDQHGVYGIGSTYGVYGQSSGGWAGYFTGANGVYGIGSTYGVYGQSSGGWAGTFSGTNGVAVSNTSGYSSYLAWGGYGLYTTGQVVAPTFCLNGSCISSWSQAGGSTPTFAYIRATGFQGTASCNYGDSVMTVCVSWGIAQCNGGGTSVTCMHFGP